MGTLRTNDYWTKVVKKVERDAQIQSKRKTIKRVDFSITLPDCLRERVAKILPYEYDEFDRNVFIGQSDDKEIAALPVEISEDSEVGKQRHKKKRAVFNESTCSEIERMEKEFEEFEMKLDEPLEDKKREKKRYNWCSGYVCKPRKKRVMWESKIYSLATNMWEKTLDEQAEQLMEASAERFTEWLNCLGSTHDSDITKERLISLFSIEGGRKFLASIQTEPKEVKAIAKTVADKWNLPDMAIELKYENCITTRLMEISKKVLKVAFGRTIPEKDRPWLPSPSDQPITTVYPDELLSGQKIFKGITHLRSVKAMIEFYRTHPSVEKPRFLVESGLFDTQKSTDLDQHVPLYELLNLKY